MYTHELQMYVVAKTIAEKAAWKYAEENGIDMVTVHPSLVLGGPFITPYTNISIDAAISLYTKDEAGIASLKMMNGFSAVHSLSLKCPDRDRPTQFEGLDEAQTMIPCSSKKLMDLGFEFAHKNKDTSDLCAETIESCREKGLL